MVYFVYFVLERWSVALGLCCWQWCTAFPFSTLSKTSDQNAGSGDSERQTLWHEGPPFSCRSRRQAPWTALPEPGMQAATRVLSSPPEVPLATQAEHPGVKEDNFCSKSTRPFNPSILVHCKLNLSSPVSSILRKKRTWEIFQNARTHLASLPLLIKNKLCCSREVLLPPSLLSLALPSQQWPTCFLGWPHSAATHLQCFFALFSEEALQTLSTVGFRFWHWEDRHCYKPVLNQVLFLEPTVCRPCRRALTQAAVLRTQREGFKAFMN